VFGADGRVVIALAIPYFNETLPGSLIAEHARTLVQAAALVTREIRGEGASEECAS
jgi:DNA-binding IclR family transcriptional regulator